MRNVLLALALIQEPGADGKAPVLTEVFRLTSEKVVSLNFSGDGRQLLLGCDGEVLLLKVEGFKTRTRADHSGLVEEALFGGNGLLILTRSFKKEAVVREPDTLDPIRFQLERVVVPAETARTGEPLERPAPYAGGCGPAAFDPDGEWVALAGGSEGLRFWSLGDFIAEGKKNVLKTVRETGLAALPLRDATEKELNAFRRGMVPQIPTVRIDQVGFLRAVPGRLWMAIRDGWLVAIPSRSIEILFRNDFRLSSSRGGAWRQAATDPSLIWQPQKGGLFRPHAKPLTTIIALPPTGPSFTSKNPEREGVLVTAAEDGHVRIWDEIPAMRSPDLNAKPVNPKPLADVAGHYAAIAPKRRGMLAVAEPSAVVLYDTETMKPIVRLKVDDRAGRIARLAFSPDDKLLAATVCACPTCRGGDAITVTRTTDPFRRHGGMLVVWKVEPASR